MDCLGLCHDRYLRLGGLRELQCILGQHSGFAANHVASNAFAVSTFLLCVTNSGLTLPCTPQPVSHYVALAWRVVPIRFPICVIVIGRVGLLTLVRQVMQYFLDVVLPLPKSPTRKCGKSIAFIRRLTRFCRPKARPGNTGKVFAPVLWKGKLFA